jgi:hypothetical protein
MRALIPMSVCVAIGLVASAACSRGRGTKEDGSAKPRVAARDDTLVEATGIGSLRIDEATVAEMQKQYGVSEPTTFSTATAKEYRRPPLGFWFVAPADGQGPPRLYAVRTLLWDDVYKGRTSKGIGILDSLDAVRAAYGEPDAEWIRMNERVHYYGRQGVIFTTQHPRDVRPALYAKARAATGKEPSDATGSAVVTEIMVVRPFSVLEAAQPAGAGQQVISTAPKTDMLIGVP